MVLGDWEGLRGQYEGGVQQVGGGGGGGGWDSVWHGPLTSTL